MLKSIERTRDGVEALIEQTRDGVIGATEKAERGAEVAAEQFVRKAHAAGERVRVRTESAATGAIRRTEDAAEAVDHGVERARTELARLSSAASNYVAANPGKTVLLTAMVGFALGLLVRSRRPAIG